MNPFISAEFHSTEPAQKPRGKPVKREQREQSVQFTECHVGSL